MRECVEKIKDFSKLERKIEAMEYMIQIHERKRIFDSLIQWVKVVYSSELQIADISNHHQKSNSGIPNVSHNVTIDSAKNGQDNT